MASEFFKIKKEVQAILAQLDINRVVVVDDYYADYPDVSVLLGVVRTLTYQKVAKHPDFEPYIKDDEDISNELLTQAWEGWSPEEREDSLKKLSRMLKFGEVELDEAVGFGPMFDDLFAEFDFVRLSLAGWKAQKTQLIEDAKEKPTLILFDQDFSNEGGGPEDGIMIIRGLMAGGTLENVFCGLLSNAANVDAERTMWKQLVEKHKVDQSKFVFIAKQRLQGEMDGFAKMIKLTVLNDRCDKLKKEAARIIADTTAEAREEIDAIDIFEFDKIVVQSSEAEGIWALDTLFRLFALFQRTKARTVARQNTSLHDLLVEVRKASELPPKTDERSEAVRIQCLENYEEPAFINGFHLPLDLGDIFINTTTNKKYILVAQPCDVILRSDGTRKIRTADLLEILDDKPGTNLHFYFKLPYYLDGDKDAWVDMRVAYAADLDLFDLCVFGPDGLAEFRDGAHTGKQWLPPTDALFGIVSEKCHALLAEGKQMKADGIPEPIIKRTLPRPSVEIDFPVRLDLEAEIIGFGLQRVRRLCPARAAALLTDYNNVQARPAFEHDLTKSKQPVSK